MTSGNIILCLIEKEILLRETQRQAQR